MVGLSTAEKRLWNFLCMASSSAEQSHEQELIATIDGCRKHVFESDVPSTEKLHQLQLHRMSLSNSLQQCEQALHHWYSGQLLLNEWIESGKKLILKDLQLLNAHLQGSSELSFRSSDVFTTQVKHVDAGSLASMMAAFWRRFEQVQKDAHPLYAACMARYFLLSIHPFSDANGRTSQLLSDYILLSHGYLPQTFPSLLTANLIGDPDKKSFMTPHEAFKRFCRTIRHSYYIISN